MSEGRHEELACELLLSTGCAMAKLSYQSPANLFQEEIYYARPKCLWGHSIQVCASGTWLVLFQRLQSVCRTNLIISEFLAHTSARPMDKFIREN